MHQTRQFTKRRPQSPAINQNNGSVEALQVGLNNKPRSNGLVIQSSAPIHFSSTLNRSSPQLSESHEQKIPVSIIQQDDHQHHHHHKEESHHNHHPHNHHSHSHEDHAHQHHSHEAHNHTLHDHILHGYDHHDHGHSHAHHDHHHQDHGHHDHHHQEHAHHNHHGHSNNNFRQVYTQPLPSYSSIFSSLIPEQKALFTCFLGHFFIGVIVWFMGASRERLSIVGFSYLVLFDAFGILNNFVSSVLVHHSGFTVGSTKRPYGVSRFEIVFALANTIFLLFGTMFTTKESLEHLLLEGSGEGHHPGGGHHSNYSIGLLIMLLIAIAASYGSSMKLRNHEKLLQLKQQFVVKNIYSASIIVTGVTVFLLQMLNLLTPTMDKLLAFIESAIMLYLGGTTAILLAKVLLQTMPDNIEQKVEQSIRSLQQQQQGSILSIDKVHFWQNSYGKMIASMEIFIHSDANENDVLESAYNLLESTFLEEAEFTISILKKE